MPKEIIFFEENKFSFKKNFFNLMNSLLKSQSCPLIEAILINAINHIQILSSFYSKQIKIFKPDKYKSDYVLYIIESIFRIKDLFKHNYFYLEILNYIILSVLALFILCCLFEIFFKEMNYIIAVTVKSEGLFKNTINTVILKETGFNSCFQIKTKSFKKDNIKIAFGCNVNPSYNTIESKFKGFIGDIIVFQNQLLLKLQLKQN